MANSSPPARLQRAQRPAVESRLSYPWADGIEFTLEELRIEDRNTEESHRRGIEQARRDHAGLRQTAIEVLNQYHLQEEQRRVQIEQEQQEARLRAEAQLAAERNRLEALKAKSIPLPPLPSPSPEPDASQRQLAEESKAINGKPASTNGEAARPESSEEAQASSSQPKTSTVSQLLNPASSSDKANPSAPTAPATKSEPSASQVQPQVTSTANVSSAGPAAAKAPAAAPAAAPDRHLEVHKKLKMLRAFMLDQSKSNPPLKSRMGDMRREIRKSMGQLVEGNLATNKQPVNKIQSNLREALQGRVPSQPVDPNEFLLQPRQPVEGSPSNNSPQVPSLFLYLLNVFAKAAIAQFINECGAKPQAADPVGTVVAKVFSDPEFQWRGGSMIDILLAKFRVVCPVLFGFRGSDRTEQGRLRVGWWRTDGNWIPEQIHVDRMTGLGAGFGAVALRDFSRSKNNNPYPPSNYWTALARIVNTPPAEISDTQCYVLKAMIEHYEPKFIHFFGSAAVAALRVALIEFPAKAPSKTAAVSALPVLAQVLLRDAGLDLK